MAVRRGYELTRFRFLRVLRMVDRDCPPEHRQVIEFTLNQSRVFFDDGEGVIGLEILVSNLHEVSFPVSAELFAELRWLATRLPMGSDYMNVLDALQP
jgi:hypothetical protein